MCRWPTRCTILINNMMHGTYNVTLTHCNMMHGTHNVTLTHCNKMRGTHTVTLTHCNMMHDTYSVTLTHCNMMHGTYSVTLTHCNMMHGTYNVTLTHCNMMHDTYSVTLTHAIWCTVHTTSYQTDDYNLLLFAMAWNWSPIVSTFTEKLFPKFCIFLDCIISFKYFLILLYAIVLFMNAGGYLNLLINSMLFLCSHLTYQRFISITLHQLQHLCKHFHCPIHLHTGYCLTRPCRSVINLPH